MKILAIDTSSEQGMVALLEDLKLLGVRFFGRQANPLMSEMESLFQELHEHVNIVDCIVVGIGPGSYTGIRVGAMVAKMLSFAGRIPLIGISSLLAWMPQERGSFAVVVDAKVGGFYMLFGEIKEDGSVTHGEPLVCPLQEAVDQLMQISHIHTPHQTLIQQRLKGMNGMNGMMPTIDITRWQWHEHAPSPYVMAKLAIHNMQAGQFNREGDLSLLYLRKTQAEIERERMQDARESVRESVRES